MIGPETVNFTLTRMALFSRDKLATIALMRSLGLLGLPRFFYPLSIRQKHSAATHSTYIVVFFKKGGLIVIDAYHFVSYLFQ